MKLWQKFAAALTVATLLYGGQFRMYTDARNRFLEHWERLDGVSIVAGIFLLALAFTVARELLARTPLRRPFDHAFLLVLGAGAISCVLTYADYKSTFLYSALLALTLVSFIRQRVQIPRRAAQLALIFSPLAVIVSWQLATFPEWSSPRETPSQKFAARPASPVFIFIFDEWSYARSTQDGEFLPGFKRLRELAEKSFVFHFAQSPGPRTDESVPRIIFQRTDPLTIGRSQTFWEHDQARLPTTETPSLFQLAREHDYNSTLLGFYLPERRILGSQVDYCHAIIEHPKPDGFAGKLRASAVRNVQFWLDPLSRRVQQTLALSIAPHSNEKTSVHWEKMLRDLRQETLETLRASPPNTFAFFHLPLPHGPWIFSENGGYVGPFHGERLSHNMGGYYRHLAFLDQVIGEFLDELRRSGTFDESMIVMTSDHSWRQDYMAGGKLIDSEQLRRVPLFIKLPGQQESVRVDAKFPLVELKPAIEAVMSGHPETAREFLEDRAPR